MVLFYFFPVKGSSFCSDYQGNLFGEGGSSLRVHKMNRDQPDSFPVLRMWWSFDTVFSKETQLKDC